ncbi:MAG: AbiV family abortive infection protein [Candidatus Dojkabacteria bacterium]
MNTTDFYKEGYCLALQNAKTLFSMANTASLESNFGIACSLNILASEEVLKASFLLIKYYYPEGKINEFDNIFRKHTVKHDQLKQYVEFQIKMQVDIKSFVVTYLPIINSLQDITPILPEQKKQEINELVGTIALFKKHSELSLDINGIFSWLENANTDKNRGFYVDRSKDKWLSPNHITKQKFDMERKFTEAFIEYVENIEQLFSVYARVKKIS